MALVQSFGRAERKPDAVTAQGIACADLLEHRQAGSAVTEVILAVDLEPRCTQRRALRFGGEDRVMRVTQADACSGDRSHRERLFAFLRFGCRLWCRVLEGLALAAELLARAGTNELPLLAAVIHLGEAAAGMAAVGGGAAVFTGLGH